MDSLPVDERSSVDPVAADQPGSVRTGPRKARVIADLALLLVVPLALLFVFTLPESLRRAGAFSYADPTLLTAFTAHYVHFTASHLLANLLGFLLLGTVAYGLSLVAGRRRLFAAATVTFLVAFPFVLSGLNLAVPRHAIGYGFSGVNMAFFGYIAVILPLAIDNRTGVNASRYTPAIFLVSVGYIALIALPMSALSLLLAAGAVAAALPYGRHVDASAARRAQRATRRLLCRPGIGECVVVAVVVLVAYPIVGFPARSSTGLQINIYVHFLGYALAFLVVHVSLLLDKTILLGGSSSLESVPGR